MGMPDRPTSRGASKRLEATMKYKAAQEQLADTLQAVVHAHKRLAVAKKNLRELGISRKPPRPSPRSAS